jgi:hypothetical protein
MGSTFEFRFSDLVVSRKNIESAMGYSEGSCEEVISEQISGAIEDISRSCSIKAEYRIVQGVKFIEEDKSVSAGGEIFNIKKIVYGQLKKADSIAVFLCTAGEEPGLKSKKAMKEGDLLKGYIYDVIGSEIVEAAADRMQEALRSEMKNSGKEITNRYSPGYCNWNVSDQHKLFRLMPDNFCGIRLTESALMDPVKSVSGFIGVGERVRFNKYTCRLCEMKNCIYRGRKS